MASSRAEKVKEALERPAVANIAWTEADLLSTGSTCLNLAITGKPHGGYIKGHYFLVVGTSSGGKTVEALTCLAEAAADPRFDEYDLILDNVEDGALMNMEKFYGKRLAGRLVAPRYDARDNPIMSRNVEDFYFNVDDANARGKPFIYVLDSMDALSSTQERRKFAERKDATRTKKKITGEMMDGKAKVNSANIRQVTSDLKATGSILIVICQTRDAVDSIAFGDSQTRSGGRSLKFYATAEIWLNKGPAIKRTVLGKERQVGMTSIVRVKKNRLSGKEWEVKIPIYWSFGIDDIGGCVDYLVEEKYWKKDDSGKITATDFELSGTRDKLVNYIEEDDLETELRSLVTDVWRKIEDACRVERKPRYT